MNPEPEVLARGKRFHRRVQRDWSIEAEGDVYPEHTIPLLASGSFRRRRHGRLDIFVDDVGGCVVVVEIKSTDWDQIPPRNRQRNVSRHRRQVWEYVDEYLASGEVDVVAGIIYPREPRDHEVRDQIVGYLNDWGIQVVWYDELSIEETG